MKNFEELESKSAQEILQWACGKFGRRAALASSFGPEDMVLIDMISKLDGQLAVFTLDTGRLHEETYETIDRVRSRYGLTIETYFPKEEAVERLVREKGFFSFRESLENRRECCGIRKVEPLKRALENLDAWITGLRRDQGVTRTNVHKVEEDIDHPPLIKINPLADWTQAQVEDYVKTRKLLVNPLHKMNYTSIGCAPCTRPTEPGEDPRAGRWWWENPEHKECGLHRPR
ncbi:MAG: phosphoadenylyl-sulfate reductase [Nitrospinales bacterium]